MLPLAIEFMSGHMNGLMACDWSQAGKVVEPGDITLLLNCFESNSFSDCNGIGSVSRFEPIDNCCREAALTLIAGIAATFAFMERRLGGGGLGLLLTTGFGGIPFVVVVPAAVVLRSGDQLAVLSIITSSTSRLLLSAFRIAHMYWSISRVSVRAVLLQII